MYACWCILVPGTGCMANICLRLPGLHCMIDYTHVLGQIVHWSFEGQATSSRSLMGSAVCAQGPCGA